MLSAGIEPAFPPSEGDVLSVERREHSGDYSTIYNGARPDLRRGRARSSKGSLGAKNGAESLRQAVWDEVGTFIRRAFFFDISPPYRKVVQHQTLLVDHEEIHALQTSRQRTLRRLSIHV